MRYAGIIKNDVVNGQGVCVSFWCQGCLFKCPGCHNPETWDFDGGIEANEDDIINEVIDSMSNNGVQRNLSILGGEPLCEENIDFVYKLIISVKKKYPNIKVFCWTGCVWELISKIHRDIMEQIDVLVDGRYEESLRDITLPFRGSSNQRVIDVKESLVTGNVETYKEWER